MITSNSELAKETTNTFTAKVYGTMTTMLFWTLCVSWLGARLGVATWFVQHPNLFLLTLLAELFLVGFYSFSLTNKTVLLPLGLIAFYTTLNGLTNSIFFQLFNHGTIFSAFAGSMVVFFTASVYGYYEPVMYLDDYLYTALFALLPAMMVSLFLHSPPLDYLISGVAVLVFAGFSAYDAGIIKQKAELNNGFSDVLSCSLNLYLDFLNLFLNLLRLLGGESSKN